MTKIMKLFSMSVMLGSLLLLASCASDTTNVRKSTSEADLRSASEVNVQLAVGYIKREQYQVAKEKLEKAIEQNDENIDAYKMMAYLMGIIDKPEEAEEYYEDALSIKDDDPEIHNSYGAFLCGQDRAEEAQEQFQLAYENPFYKTRYLAYSNAGTCLIKAGEYKQAESLLRRALQDQPKLQSALLSMAEVGVRAEKYLMARAYIQRYHADNEPSAESLWLEMQAEKALGSRKHYVEAALKLLELYPDSQQAGEVEESVRNERTR